MIPIRALSTQIASAPTTTRPATRATVPSKKRPMATSMRHRSKHLHRGIPGCGWMEAMRVARLYGAGDLRVSQEPDPIDVPAGHRRVRVTAVGLCGSDLHWFAEGGIGDAVVGEPLVLGHEFAGVLDDGTRVAVDPAIPCGVCASCLEGHPNLCPAVRFAGHSTQDGGLRELLVWPAHRLHPLPDTISDAGGAALEPLGVAIHAFDLG